MTEKKLKGDDGRVYIITTDSDLANKVTRISDNYIHIDSNIYHSEIDNIYVKLEEPLPLDAVPMKYVFLEGEKK